MKIQVFQQIETGSNEKTFPYVKRLESEILWSQASFQRIQGE